LKPLALVGLLATAYLLVLVFPEPLFAHSLTAGHFTFRSPTPIDPGISAIVADVESRLSRSEIYDANVHHRVFIVEDPTLWSFLNGPYRRAMARNVEIGYAILVPRLDVKNRAIVHFDGRHAGAVNILAHEATHTYLGRRFGALATWRLPWWKREGYAEYVASGGLVDSEAPAGYQQAARVWRHLLIEAGWTFERVIASQTPVTDLLKQPREPSR
jgi:hypothetical protein